MKTNFKTSRGNTSIILVLVAACTLPLSVSSLAQLPTGSASLHGTVRDAQGTPVAGASVQLKSKISSQSSTTHTDSQGKYVFANIREDVFAMNASMTGHRDCLISSVFLGPNEEKTVDLTLPAESSSSGQPQFFDEPQFTVAGVTDTTNLGGHGSDVVVRTREKLAADTASLGKTTPGITLSTAAEKSLREELAHQPSSFEVNHRLGQFLVETARSQEAIVYLEQAAKLEPGDYENAYELVLANSNAGHNFRARDDAQNLLAKSEKAEIHHLLGDVNEKLGDPLEAVRQYQRAVEMDPSEPYLFDWAAELLLHHAPEPALEVFKKGARLFPKSSRMLVGVGVASFAHGSNESAEQALCAASDLDPNNPASYLFLGKMQRAEFAPSPEAVEKLHRFVTLQPDNAEANYYYAAALWKSHKGHTDPASISEIESHLNRSIRLDPKLAVAHLQLGILHADQQKNAEAITDYQRALQIDPQMEEAHYRLAQAYRKTGEADKARREAELYQECVKESEQKNERERHEIRQFVYTLRDQATPQAP